MYPQSVFLLHRQNKSYYQNYFIFIIAKIPVQLYIALALVHNPSDKHTSSPLHQYDLLQVFCLQVFIIDRLQYCVKLQFISIHSRKVLSVKLCSGNDATLSI